MQTTEQDENVGARGFGSGGAGLDQSLPFIPKKYLVENNIPTDSPIWGTANVQVLAAKIDDDEPANQRQIILPKT
jgi:hypothetical protein